MTKRKTTQTRNLEPEGLHESEPHQVGTEAPTPENDPVGRFRSNPLEEASRMLGRAPIPVDRNHVKNEFRRSVVGGILARLLGSKAACDEIKFRQEQSREPLFSRMAARVAIEFADSLIDELEAREKRL